MNAFLITVSLALATAAPQYNYQQANGGFQKFRTNFVAPQEDQRTILQDALRIPQISQTILGPGPDASQFATTRLQPINFQGNVLQQQIVPQIQHLQQRPQPVGQQQQFNYQTAQLGRVVPVVTKDIYVHAAPEEPEERYQRPQPILPPRKHYRIVFIKAPTPQITKATLNLQQAPVEEKTIIYVLSKKPEPLDLQTLVQEAPRQPSKPEVYFIKYKTQEEAAHAQRAIQAQFDSLGGTSSVSDEGIAPVTSVIGVLQNQQQQQQNLVTSGSNIVGNELPSYLPPHKK